MSTDSEPTKRKRFQITQNIKAAISLLRNEAREKVRLLLNRPKVHTLSEVLQNVTVGKISIEQDYKCEIKSVNQLYVLSKNLSIDPIYAKSILNELSIAPVKGNFHNFKEFTISNKVNETTIDPFFATLQSYTHIIFNAILKALTIKPFNEITPGYLEVKEFRKPKFVTEKLGFKTRILERSRAFPLNLPIERKQLSLLMLSEPELNFFKQKLAEKFKTNWRLIKITSLYNKLNVKNIQNIKLDPVSEKVFFTFKPDIKQSDELFAFMVSGRRRDTNEMISLMVNELEYRKFKSEYTG